ncbi:MAG: glycosyltransferase family 1 protein [Nitrospirae bacterium]|nr:glycosyltransferase family 1 protein [Nitrospirota bacterium]
MTVIRTASQRPRVLWFSSSLYGNMHWQNLEVVRVGPESHADIRLPWQGLYVLGPVVDQVKPDVLVVEDGYGFRIVDLDRLSLPSIYVIRDAQVTWPVERYYAPLFDRTAVLQTPYMDAGRALGFRMEQFPPFSGTPPATCARLEPSFDRPLDVSFIGGFVSAHRYDADRHRFLNDVARWLPQSVSYFFGRGDPREVYPRSKIVLNHSLKGEATLRIFEAMSCGALVVSGHCPASLRGLLEPGRDLLTYRWGDARDAARVVMRALEDPEGSLAVARSGWNVTHRDHLMARRMERWGELVREMIRMGPWPVAEDEAAFHLGMSLMAVLLLRPVASGAEEAMAFEKLAHLYLETTLAACERIPVTSPYYSGGRALAGLVHALRGDLFMADATLKGVRDRLPRDLTVVGGRPRNGSCPRLPAQGRLGLLVRAGGRVVEAGVGLIAYRMGHGSGANRGGDSIPEVLSRGCPQAILPSP